MVFFLRQPGSDWVVIGEPHELRASLEAYGIDVKACASPFSIVSMMDAPVGAAELLRERFRNLELRSGTHRHWFAATPELQAYIARHAKPWDGRKAHLLGLRRPGPAPTPTAGALSQAELRRRVDAARLARDAAALRGGVGGLERFSL